jgi:hypothetical protein
MVVPPLSLRRRLRHSGDETGDRVTRPVATIAADDGPTRLPPMQDAMI